MKYVGHHPEDQMITGFIAESRGSWWVEASRKLGSNKPSLFFGPFVSLLGAKAAWRRRFGSGWKWKTSFLA